jgi:DNA invertase Pin-like site-specific DNA recombinase
MKYISYYRVSTQKQSNSGLGLEAQRYVVEQYITQQKGEIFAEFIEIETAGNKDHISIGIDISIDKLLKKRPKLLEAIGLAQREKAVLVVKEGSRLSRFSLLIDFLLVSNVQFICADSPTDTPMIIKLKTAINEDELLKISERTRMALQAKKARGFNLGKPENLTDKAREISLKVRQRNAQEDKANKQASTLIVFYRKEGKTFQQIAEELNKAGYKARRGKPFQPSTIKMLFDRSNNTLNQVTS